MDECNRSIECLAQALRTLRLQPAWDEYEIHAAVMDCFTRCGISYVHEAVLAPRCRADFLIDGCVVLEIKRGKPSPSVYRKQLDRYLACEQVKACVLVAEKRLYLPKKIQGKPCFTLSLSELWGVAL